MKWFILLIFGFLAESSAATTTECHSSTKVNLTLGISTFAAAVSTIPTPTLANGDVSSGIFATDFLSALRKFIPTLAAIHYSQAVAAGEHLVDTIWKDWKELYELVRKSKSSKESSNPDECLKILTRDLDIFMDLQPGNVKIKRPVLPDLPPQPTEVVSQTKNRTANEIFLGFSKYVNDEASSTYGFIASIFLKGWSSAREMLDVVQDQYRDEILNDWVMDAYNKVVNLVFKNRDLIQKHVEKKTWDSFAKVGGRISAIAHDYCNELLKNDTNRS